MQKERGFEDHQHDGKNKEKPDKRTSVLEEANSASRYFTKS